MLDKGNTSKHNMEFLKWSRPKDPQKLEIMLHNNNETEQKWPAWQSFKTKPTAKQKN